MPMTTVRIPERIMVAGVKKVQFTLICVGHEPCG